MKNIFKIASIIWTLLVIIFTSVAVYWVLFDDNPPLVFNTPPLVTSEFVTEGSHIEVFLDFCKYTSAPTLIRMSMVQSDNGEQVIVFLPPRTPPLVNRGCTTRNLLIDVPLHIHSGVYQLHMTFIYEVNPLSTRTVDVYSNVFEIN